MIIKNKNWCSEISTFHKILTSLMMMKAHLKKMIHHPIPDHLKEEITSSNTLLNHLKEIFNQSIKFILIIVRIRQYNITSKIYLKNRKWSLRMLSISHRQLLISTVLRDKITMNIMQMLLVDHLAHSLNQNPKKVSLILTHLTFNRIKHQIPTIHQMVCQRVDGIASIVSTIILNQEKVVTDALLQFQKNRRNIKWMEKK